VHYRDRVHVSRKKMLTVTFCCVVGTGGKYFLNVGSNEIAFPGVNTAYLYSTPTPREGARLRRQGCMVFIWVDFV